MQGWVSFHRQIMKWEWYTDSNTFRLFFHLVLNANHEKGRWKGIEIERGQHLTSSEKLAEQLDLSRQQIRTSLKKLEKTQEITIKSTNKFTVVTIAKYDLYQDDKRKVTSKSTNEQPASNQQVTTNNNKDNINTDNKKEKDIIINKIWAAYPLKKGKAKAIEKIPKLLKKYSVEELLNSIIKYDKSVKDKKYLVHGSTFFNGTYLDYIGGGEVGENIGDNEYSEFENDIDDIFGKTENNVS